MRSPLGAVVRCLRHGIARLWPGEAQTAGSVYGWAALLAVFWSALLVASLFWWNQQASRQAFSLAGMEARASFNKDVSFRLWATTHGGVYVPVTEHTPPNPDLAHIEERDVTTPSGRELTLMNPAYMLRQLMSEYGDDFGVRGRITSLKLLNEANAPDAWERAALERFEQGEGEAMELVDAGDGGGYLRLMRPLYIEEACLKCHGEQGYQVGDVRGGVGVSVAMAPYRRLAHEQIRRNYAAHGLVWLLGLAGIGAGARGVRQRAQEQAHFQERIWRQANIDSLTGLANRARFLERLDAAVSASAADGSGMALLFIDLDQFKDVNDSRGHATGDQLLCRVAQRIQGCLQPGALLGRLGGDEFTVLMEADANAEVVRAQARRVVDAFAAPFTLNDGRLQIYVSASIGIAFAPDDAVNSASLLSCADAALYRAKADGRNTLRFYEPWMTADAERRLSLEHALWDALERDEFVLHYQPIFRTVDRQLLTVEALVRWQRPGHGLVAPDGFIDVAERYGQMVRLGEWVLRAAIAQLQTWRQQGLDVGGVSVNVSITQCRDPQFLSRLERIAREFGPETVRLTTLEITESLYLGDPAGALRLLASMRELGFSVHIDDFGTGYSSLAYLKQTPLDGLKIDRSFVRDLVQDPRDRRLCRTIIELAHDFDMHVVAEGVENEAQLELLRDMGCDQAQGYLLGRPMEAAKLARLASTARGAA